MELLETVIDNANAGNKYWAKDGKEWKKYGLVTTTTNIIFLRYNTPCNPAMEIR